MDIGFSRFVLPWDPGNLGFKLFYREIPNILDLDLLFLVGILMILDP